MRKHHVIQCAVNVAFPCHNSDGPAASSRKKLDPGKKPAHVDAVTTEGLAMEAPMLGIYELKGETLRMCFDPKGKERPTSLTPKAGQFAVVLQREKK